jgi:hypothetical protein
LPAPTFVTTVESTFHLNVPVTASLQELAKALQTQVGGRTLLFEGKRSLKVNRIALGSSGDKLLVRVNVEALAGFLVPRLEGDVTIEGVPVLSEDASTLRFDRRASSSVLKFRSRMEGSSNKLEYLISAKSSPYARF